MMSEKQIARTLEKLIRLETTLAELLFRKVGEAEMRRYQTGERLHEIPAEDLFTACAVGDTWGGDDAFCWFRGRFTPGPELDGRRLYLYPKTTGYEAMLWVNGEPAGAYAAKFIENSHGNHYCVMLADSARAGAAIDIALEYYAGHFNIGSVPLKNDETRDFLYRVGPADVCVKDERVAGFLFDLKALNGLVKALGKNSFRRAEVVGALLKVHEMVLCSPEDAGEEAFFAALEAARPCLTEMLERKNSPSAPVAGIIGHSHMDTAWLWVHDETIKKCARTYANQLSLMEQYPEYLFIQSASYHSEMIRRFYPSLFERIQKRVAEGRYEPNGGVWVECDCNLVSGEMLARQFLWGQRFTQKHFGYTSDCFWLPDTFGYSAAIPQIMAQSGVKYFLTTKMSWNDTNRFPYETFWWKGLDGTRVLSHLNRTHIWPSPEALVEYVAEGRATGDCIQEKTVSKRRLLSFGFGDGGGGPQFEMLEAARRVGDLEGLPRAEYTTVSGFMRTLEETLLQPSTYSGELYLELHRGTLTNQHQIKRNNRLCEIALHNLEYLTVHDALQRDIPADGDGLRPLVETLLVNQFHDILPGTCIPEVHEQSLRETGALLAEAGKRLAAFAGGGASGEALTLVNTVSFERDDVVYLDVPAGTRLAEDAVQQRVDTLHGEKLAVAGLKLKPFSARSFILERGGVSCESPFRLEGNRLETPFAEILFDESGRIASFKDKTARGRELRGGGYPLNTLLIAEDVPLDWDNWDIDADLEQKFRPVTELLGSRVVAEGPVELRIRNEYRLSEKSTLVQDVVFYADSPLVRFETRMDWRDNHRFLKAAFDTSLETAESRQEVQFGCIRRATSRNDDLEKAKFEVVNHKYADLSETRYGAAILNDCKYGVSVHEGSIRLSLHKGGTRPDYKGDHGTHDCVYAFLPHNGGFSASAVVRPGYRLNYKPIQLKGRLELAPLLELQGDAVIAETVKPCEDAGRIFAVRLYESEGSTAHTELYIPGAQSITPANLLEQPVGGTVPGERVSLSFRPFEIQTMLVRY